MRRLLDVGVRAMVERAGFSVERLRWPDEATHEDVAVMESALPFTMVSRARLWSAVSAVKYVVTAGVPGAVVEAGVWKGGCSFAMASTLHQMAADSRGLWLYDTFDGMTAPTDRDIETASRGRAATILDRSASGSTYWARAHLEQVERLVAGSGMAPEHVHVVQGDVLQTLPEHAPARIAVLRLDTDWYESTKWELENLFDRVSPGGVIIFDDYGHWEGSRAAVDEFFARRALTPLLQVVDYSGRQMIKI